MKRKVDMEFFNGQMGPFMMEIGKMINNTVLENIIIQMEIFIKEIGNMILKMGTVFFNGKMVVNMKDTEKMIIKVVMENLLILTKHFI